MAMIIDNNTYGLTVEGIRKYRSDFSERHTDKDGNYDWKGAVAEIEKGGAVAMAEIERMRADLTEDERCLIAETMLEYKANPASFARLDEI